MPPTRRAPCKRQKRQERQVSERAVIRPGKNKRSVEDELICPITHSLPFDPVMAEDGRIYERSAIKQYFRSPLSMVRSPMTGARMGKHLITAHQAKNTIEALIENGMITGDLADNWTEKYIEAQEKEELMKKAEQGDAEAMLEVAANFISGVNGFDTDCEEAHKWQQKAHSAGSIIGTVETGENLVLGYTVGDTGEENVPLGLVYLGIGAGKGSDKAAYLLGSYFANGKHGLPVDKGLAIKFLEDSLKECDHEHMALWQVGKAREKLSELLDE